MLIKDAIDLNKRTFISIVGAGGKSTLFSLLAHELYKEKKNIILTTTTHMFADQLIPFANKVSLIENNNEKIILKRMNYFFKKGKYSELILIHHRLQSELGEKVTGPSTDFLKKCWMSGYADYFIVEADGARGKSIKSPAAHEPVICDSTTDVIGVVGIDALGLTLSERNVFRPVLFSQLTGLKIGEKICINDMVALICHPNGLFKNIPLHSKAHLFINKADSNLEKQSARKIAIQVLKSKDSKIDEILIGSGYNKTDPVTEIVKRR